MASLMRWLARCAAQAGCGLLVAGLGLSPAAAAPPCDGRSDATAAIQAAVAAGGAVRLPPGTCLVSGTIQVGSATTLTGAGADATVLKATVGGTFPVLMVGGPTQATGAHDVDISALAVDGNATAHGARLADGILVRFGSGHVRIHDLAVRRAAENGIEDNGSDVEIADSVSQDNVANGIYVVGKGNKGGLNIVPARNVRILRNRVLHNSLGKAPGHGPTWDGIDVDPMTQDCLVQGNTVIGNDIIVLASGAMGGATSGFRVIANLIEDSIVPAVIVQGPVDDFVVANNRIIRANGWGIVVNGPVDRGVVQGNIIQGTTLEGILVKNTSPEHGPPTDVSVIGNTIDTGPRADGHAAIAAAQYPRGLRVQGNRILGRPPGPGAIDLRQAGPGLVVQGNG